MKFCATLQGETTAGVEQALLSYQTPDGETVTHEPEAGTNASAGFIEEAKQQMKLAGPLIPVSILQYCLQIMSIMFVGHLGELSLECFLEDFLRFCLGFLLCMASALKTLCGQSYDAKEYHMLGIHTQKPVLVLLASSVPLAVIWYFTGDNLVLLGQNKAIATGTGQFNRWMIPSLFAYAVLQYLNRFLQP